MALPPSRQNRLEAQPALCTRAVSTTAPQQPLHPLEPFGAFLAAVALRAGAR